MKKFTKKINKYIVLLIISSVFGRPWTYAKPFIFGYNTSNSLMDLMPVYIEYGLRLVIVALLIIDFRKENLKYIVLTAIATCFYPLLGAVVFAILLLEKATNEKQEI